MPDGDWHCGDVCLLPSQAALMKAKRAAPHLPLLSGAANSVAVLAFNLPGDGLDPRSGS
jgi:hypothetical protein